MIYLIYLSDVFNHIRAIPGYPGHCSLNEFLILQSVRHLLTARAIASTLLSVAGQVTQRDVDRGEVKCSARMTARYSDGEEFERDADTAVSLPALASLSVGRFRSVQLFYFFALCFRVDKGVVQFHDQCSANFVVEIVDFRCFYE